jgi:hypothetical protein
MGLTQSAATVLIRALSPGPTPHKRICIAQVAQLVEQRIENPRVGGSIPPLGTKPKSLASAGLFYGEQGRMRTTDVVR